MEKPARDKKAALELDKFKRRLIRAVARLLLVQKKPEEEIWIELKKETCCDCELLWARMRALTLKKLNRLFLANDRMDAVPVPARMSLTDWLMFDLVLVHQKIDLIGQDELKDGKPDPPVLEKLFHLVRKFNIENLKGDNLAEAWSMATLYYNNQGHHCSPMLLQRRWYQLKEATRVKFYNYWYAYRGSSTRVLVAEPFKPSPLQTHIAQTFKIIITRPFPEWEELINQKLVTLPEEFEKKMKAKAAQRHPPVRKPSVDVPDLVMIEPKIDTIDLRQDDNVTEEETEEGGIPVPPLVRIKQEPRDDMDVDETPPEPPKKSIFEVVLESTDLENSQIDRIDEEYDHEYDDNQESPVRDEEESQLPQIGSVFGNVRDTSVLGNIDKDRVYGIAGRTTGSGDVDNTNVSNDGITVVRETITLEDAEENVCCSDNNTVDDDNSVDGSIHGNDNCNTFDDNSARKSDQVIEVSSDDKDDACNVEIRDDVRDPSPEASDNIPDEINEISDDEINMSGNIAATNVLGRVDETSVVGNVVETSGNSNVDKTDVVAGVDATNVVGSINISNVIGGVTATNAVGSIGITNVIGGVDATDPVGSIGITNVIGGVDATDPVGSIGITNVIGSVDSVEPVGSIDISNTIGGGDTSDSVSSIGITNVIGSVGATDGVGSIGISNVIGSVDAIDPVGSISISNVVGSVDDVGSMGITNVIGGVDATNGVGSIGIKNVIGGIDAIDPVGSIGISNVIGSVDTTNVIRSVDKTSVTFNIEGASQPGTTEDIPSVDILNAQTTDSTVTKTAEEKEVEIIEHPLQSVVITDSEDDDHIVDDLIINQIVSETIQEIMPSIKTTDQPVETKILEVSLTESVKVNEDDGKKIEVDVKPDLKSFKFGELPQDISFADDGIEFVDDGIAYVDEDSQDEIQCKDEDEDNPRIDPKLLMCPIVYTIRLDNMGLFRTRPFDHITDKQLLDAITKESKPVKKEKVEKVTVNYGGEKNESVTVSDNNKSIEFAPKRVSKIDDSTIVIQKEPANVHSKTIVSQDDIVPVSDDSDYSENFIDESQKVKPTSYLLQKPRSRRYHPIQLCKNPDFNTRLKRLSVGFFSSPRNRVLIKSCKPLTIDLSKAFESKLISGTLYLKPPDHNVTAEVIDDSESHSVSVVPSAMPAQSLIDNSKVADILPMLQQCLEASKQPADVVPTSERNKVINLPDISEIRRINQRLLTAEVTPIQVQNNQPQVPVTIVPHRNTPTYFPQETITSSETVQDSQKTVDDSPANATIDLRGPPKLLEIMDDSPSKTLTDLKDPSELVEIMDDSPANATPDIRASPNVLEIIDDSPAKTVTDTRAPAKSLEIMDDSPAETSTEHTASTGRQIDYRFIDGFRPRQPIITGRPPRMNHAKRMITPKFSGWKPRQIRPKIPWLTKNNDATLNTKQIEETLLTLDALNKMLFLLTDVREPPEIPKNPKPKPKRRSVGLQTRPNRGRPRVSRFGVHHKVPYEEEPFISDEHDTPCQMPKINIKAAINYPSNSPKISNKDKNLGMDKEPKKSFVYCCWAREKMLQLLFRREHIPPHGCDTLCNCCCRQLLKDYTLQEQKIKLNQLQIIKGSGNNSDVTLLRGGMRVNFHEDAYNSIQPIVENTPQSSVEGVHVPHVTDSVYGSEPVLLPEQTPVIDLDAPNTESNTNENQLFHIQATNIEENVPSPVGEVFVRSNAVVPPPIVGEPNSPIKPIKAKRKYVAIPIGKKRNVMPGVSPEICIQAIPCTHCVSSDNQSGGILLNSTKTLEATITPHITTSSSFTKLLAIKKSKVLNTFKPSMPLAPSFMKPFVPPKHIREKMIFLNSKQISEKPTSNPLNVGKNKILLTTIKFPPNLKLFHEAIDALEDSLSLPPGVHIILLGDGTVSYKIDHNVEVTATDMKDMPALIAAVRAHMDTHAAQEEAMKKQNATAGEVVDLVDDDDISALNVNDNYNTTPEVAKVQSTEENLIQIDVETEQNRTISNVNVIDKENNQQEFVENTVIDMQENRQESSQNEMLSASTEQLQGQPDPSSKGNVEKDHQPEPSSQIKSTDVNEVSALQAQDRPGISKSEVSAEIVHQSNPLRQTESSDVQELTLKQSQDQLDSSRQHVDIDLAETASQEGSDVRQVEQAQSEISGQNATIEVQDLREPGTQELSTDVLEKNTSALIIPKSKNILSDLMEMSGIFDEDMAPETAKPAEQVVIPEVSLQTPVPALQVVQPPAQSNVLSPAPAAVCKSTPIIRPIMIPTAFNRTNPVPPKIQSALGELTAITSLYELKYAVANKGIFFKLDTDNGYLIPINVCMKSSSVPNPQAPKPKLIPPKSVIDLTEDDDRPEPAVPNICLETSPNKESPLLDSSSSATSGCVPAVSLAGPAPKPLGSTGPAIPVKLFKGLKPSILQRLDVSKIRQGKNLNSTLDHNKKRKQFFKEINMNANIGSDCMKPKNPVLMRPFLKKITLNRNLIHTYKGKKRPRDKEPTATTSHTEPTKEFATTILSDDSSDDEPLAKIAKRKHENANGSESVPMEIESDLPVTDSNNDLTEREAPGGEHIGSELSAARAGSDPTNDNIDDEAPVEKPNELELPANDNASVDDCDSQGAESAAVETETFYMSDDNDFIDPYAPFGFESGEDDEDCILGV